MAVTEETKAKIQKVRELVRGGVATVDALKQVSLSSGSWYTHKPGAKKAKGTIKVKRSKAPTYIDMTPAQTASVAIILCAHDQVKTILAGLK